MGATHMNILFFLTPKEDVAHVEETDTMRQVLEKMEHHGYTAIPLLGVEGKYIGTITEGDLLWFLKDRNFPDLKLLEDMPITSIERRRDNQSGYSCPNKNLPEPAADFSGLFLQNCLY